MTPRDLSHEPSFELIGCGKRPLPDRIVTENVQECMLEDRADHPHQVHFGRRGQPEDLPRDSRRNQPRIAVDDIYAAMRRHRIVQQSFGLSGDQRYLLHLGAAEYRAGQFSAAVARLEEARSRVPFDGRRTEIDLFLAMGYPRLGRRDDARRVLAEAKQRIASHDRSAEARGGQPGWLWFEWVRCKTLCREAEALLGAAASPADQNPRPP